MSNSDYRKHEVQPQNKQDEYTEFNQVDFLLSFEGRKIELNTIRLLGEIQLLNQNALHDTRVDPFVGAHTFFQEILSSSQNQGLLESVNSYPRYVGMESKGLNSLDNNFNSDDMAALKSFSSTVSGNKMKGDFVFNAGATANLLDVDADFSLRPNICFNNAVGDVYLSHTKSGDLTISFRLASNSNYSFGNSQTANTTYTLKNLRMTFNSVPDDGQDKGRILRSKVGIEQSINSTFSSISANVPAVCTGVSGSAVLSSYLGDPKKNANEQQRLPNISRLSFLFNNSASEYVTYEITNNVDLNQRYLESWLGRVGNNFQNMENLNANDGWGVGLNFDSQVDLSNQKFGVQIESDVNNTSYVLFLYFHGLIQM